MEVCVEEKEKEEWEKREDEGSKQTEIRGIVVERKRQRDKVRHDVIVHL